MLIKEGQLGELYKKFKQKATGQNTPVQIFASLKVDSVCAVRILQQLLHVDQVTYELHPVQGYEDIQRINQTQIIPRIDEVHSIVLINCGGNYDMHELLFGKTMEEDGNDIDHVCVYIIDSQRPFALENVYNQNNIFLLDDEKDKGLENYPPLVDESDDDESEAEDSEYIDSEEDEFEGENPRPSKRRRLGDVELRAKAERRKGRLRIQEYYKYTRWAKSPASAILYQMAAAVNKSDNALLWLSILGLTDMFVNSRMERDTYDGNLLYMKTLVTTFNEFIKPTKSASWQMDQELNSTASSRRLLELNGASAADSTILGASSIMDDGTEAGSQVGYDDDTLVKLRPTSHIQESKEFQFHLMRQWNLFDSMYHSRYVATKLNVWTNNGRERLKNMLAKMAVKLEEARQPWVNMSVELRRTLAERVEQHAEDYQLGEKVCYSSFTRQHGLLEEISASDMVHGLDGLLEDDRLMPEMAKDRNSLEQALTKRWDDNFARTIQALSVDHCDLLEQGIKYACKRQSDIVAMGTRLIEKRMVKGTGVIRHATIQQKNNFTNPVTLARLGLFVVEAYREHQKSLNSSNKKNKKYKDLPFVLASLCDVRNSYMVVGIPEGTSMRMSTRGNLFGTAFQTAREKVNARARHSGFETAVIEIQQDDYQQFLRFLERGLSL